MPGKLKKYREYKRRLKLYSRAIGVKLEYTDEEDESAFVPTKGVITLYTRLTQSEKIAVFLHELGHAMDDAFHNKLTAIAINNAYYAVYHGRPGTAQRALVLETEARAWRFGRAIAKRCRIKLGKWYEETRKTSIASYKKS